MSVGSDRINFGNKYKDMLTVSVLHISCTKKKKNMKWPVRRSYKTIAKANM